MSSCETMCKLVCKPSKLKSDSYLFKNENSYCDMCQNLAYEDAEHIMMYCPFFDNHREKMFTKLYEVELNHDVKILSPGVNMFHILLGKFPPECEQSVVFEMLKIIAVGIEHMYSTLIKSREGIG